MLISQAAAFEAIKPVFAAMARGAATNFPVMREALGGWRQCGFESGQDRAGSMLSVKPREYFPANAERGMINHQSIAVDFHPELTRLWSEPLGLDHGNPSELSRLAGE